MNKPRRMSLLLVSIALAGLLAASCADTNDVAAVQATAAAAVDRANEAVSEAQGAASDAGEALAGIGATAADVAAAAADATAAGAEAAAAGAEAAAATAAASAALAAADASKAAADLALATAEGNQAAVAAAEEALAAAQAAADAASADAAAAQAEAESAQAEAAAAQAEAAEARAEAAAAQAEAEAAQAEAAEAQAQTEVLMREALIAALDMTGDGDVVFGVATAGPRDDGAYYQALVETVEEFSAVNGFSAPIIVDNIQPADAATELRNLAEQGVDVLAVGAGEIAEPLATLTEEYPEIFWYCNCGAGYQELPGLAQSQDDGAQIGYSAGYATGLLLRDSGGDTAHFIGCCDLPFEVESYLSFEMGLKAVDESFAAVYVPTGRYPFDFDNIAGATEAFNSSAAEGADAVYPYLGGAHEPVVALANENGIITMSAGASDVCERSDLHYDIAVQFDAGDYIATLLELIADGAFGEGESFLFSVGAFPFVGAKMCDPTPEQQAEFEAELARIAAGTYAEALFAIKAEAYGF
jgi:basic membrane protein A